MGGGGLGKDFFKISHFLDESMNKFDSHVVLFEKWLLNASVGISHSFISGENFSLNSKIQASRPFERKRLRKYFSKSNKILTFPEFCAEYRKAINRARLL